MIIEIIGGFVRAVHEMPMDTTGTLRGLKSPVNDKRAGALAACEFVGHSVPCPKAIHRIASTLITYTGGQNAKKYYHN